MEKTETIRGYWYFWQTIEYQRWISAKTRRDFCKLLPKINRWQPREATTRNGFQTLHEISAMLNRSSEGKGRNKKRSSVQHMMIPRYLAQITGIEGQHNVMDAIECIDLEAFKDRSASASPSPTNTPRDVTLTNTPRSAVTARSDVTRTDVTRSDVTARSDVTRTDVTRSDVTRNDATPMVALTTEAASTVTPTPSNHGASVTQIEVAEAVEPIWECGLDMAGIIVSQADKANRVDNSDVKVIKEKRKWMRNPLFEIKKKVSKLAKKFKKG